MQNAMGLLRKSTRKEGSRIRGDFPANERLRANNRSSKVEIIISLGREEHTRKKKKIVGGGTRKGRPLGERRKCGYFWE